MNPRESGTPAPAGAPEPGPAAAAYRGRFAPSPTGPLHFGSLVAALGSWLQARACRGHWLVRIEDIDPPREVPGAADDILRTLEVFGLHWDEEVTYQSARIPRYLEVLDTLQAQRLAYRCVCTRKEIEAYNLARLGHPSRVYPGLCRLGPARKRRRYAVRLLTGDDPVTIEDMLQGVLSQVLATEVGDFVLRRRDGLVAYQLAVVVDDAEQSISEVVRGCDLLDSTPRQVFLQRALGLPVPRYMHLPVAEASPGTKLSKQTGASPVDPSRRSLLLWKALEFLEQAPPRELRRADAREILDWATSNWRPGRLTGRRSRSAPSPKSLAATQ